MAQQSIPVSPPARIFLCHSSGDKAAVRNLYKKLQADGFEPWLDEEDLLPGQLWQNEITHAVRDSAVVLVCLSQSSIGKTGYVQKEIRFALDAADEHPEGQIFLIPVRLEECTIPERLAQWHGVNLFEASGYERLLKALLTRGIGRRPPPPSNSHHVQDKIRETARKLGYWHHKPTISALNEIRRLALEAQSEEASDTAVRALVEFFCMGLVKDDEEATDKARVLRKLAFGIIRDVARLPLASYFQNGELEYLDLCGIDFSHQQLAGVSFKSAFLVEANFEGATLHNASLVDAFIRNAKFAGATLVQADLTNADWFNALGLSADQLRQAKQQGIAVPPGTVDALHEYLKGHYGLPFDSWTDQVKSDLLNAWELYLKPGGLVEAFRVY